MTTRYLAIFEHPEEGTDWGAYVPDLPGCIAVAKSKAECATLSAEAIEFHIEGMLLDGEPVPPPTVEAEMIEIPIAA